MGFPLTYKQIMKKYDLRPNTANRKIGKVTKKDPQKINKKGLIF